MQHGIGPRIFAQHGMESAVAGAFTGRPGQIVPLAETIRACKELPAGMHDDMPEYAFMWRGTIGQVVADTAEPGNPRQV